MSRWSTPSDELDRRINRALVVQEYSEHSALDYLAHLSEADPLHITEEETDE